MIKWLGSCRHCHGALQICICVVDRITEFYYCDQVSRRRCKQSMDCRKVVGEGDSINLHIRWTTAWRQKTGWMILEVGSLVWRLLAVLMIKYAIKSKQSLISPLNPRGNYYYYWGYFCHRTLCKSHNGHVENTWWGCRMCIKDQETVLVDV